MQKAFLRNVLIANIQTIVVDAHKRERVRLLLRLAISSVPFRRGLALVPLKLLSVGHRDLAKHINKCAKRK